MSLLSVYCALFEWFVSLKLKHGLWFAAAIGNMQFFMGRVGSPISQLTWILRVLV